ncbi:MAG: hypothetical protein IJU96_07350 [Clostridia bacterium]|nr:hypothetical protein [Clostridia bacterium]
MKKLTAVFLSILLAFSALTLGANAADTPKTQKLIDAINGGQAVKVTLKSGTTMLGSSSDTFIIKGNALAYEYNTGLFNIRLLLKDGALYAYLPKLPFFYVKMSALELGMGALDVPTLVKLATGATFAILRYVKSYQETIDGVNYDVEEYFDNASVTAKFCYVGDQLKLLKVTDAQTHSVQNTYFESISFDVSDSEVAAPVGLNVTPLFKVLFASLLVSALIPA